jgi:hypothetical protein
MPPIIEVLSAETNEPICVRTSELISFASIKEGNMTILKMAGNIEIATQTPYLDFKSVISREAIKSIVPRVRG